MSINNILEKANAITNDAPAEDKPKKEEPKMTQDHHELLKEFPALESVVHRIHEVDGIIANARLYDNGNGGGLAFHISFEFDNRGITYTVRTLSEIAELLRVTDANEFADLPGQYVRIQTMSQASWCPFFRVSHITDNTRKSVVFRYAVNELDRYAEGGRV